MKKSLFAAAVLTLLGAVPAVAGSGTYIYRIPIPGLVGEAQTSTPATYNFSSCGQTGRTGPTLAQCQTAYASQPGILASLAMPGYQGYQEWTAPATGSYTITAAGAGAGTTTYTGATGGSGAIMRATVNLSQGDVLQIVVGQAGINAPVVSSVTQTDAGGGGGTFVVKKSGNQPLVVAGGGGGSSYYNNGQYYGNGGNGTTSTTGGTSPTGFGGGTNGTGGTAGNGGTTGYGEPGAGFLSNSGYPGWGSTNFTVSDGFQSGAVGGVSTNALPNRYGGFGGGGGGHGNNCTGGGGGGGYSGGGGAAVCQGGGGGGSFIAAGATALATSDGQYNGATVGSALGYVGVSTPGYVTITQN